MADPVNLPSSSLSELEKIIKAYGHIGKEADLDTLSKLTGIGKTTISPNNPFLVDTEIVSSGKKKKISELGLRLARALDHSHTEDAANCWHEIVSSSEFLSNLVSTIRIKGSISVDDAASHALYASGQKKSKANRTGARAVIDILIASGAVAEESGALKVTVKKAVEEKSSPVAPLKPEESVQENTVSPADAQPQGLPVTTPSVLANPVPGIPISINIELHLPATSDPEVYKELFKALRENLLNPTSGD